LSCQPSSHLDSVGYPVISYYRSLRTSTRGGFNLGGANATGQIPKFIGNFGLIDQDTPKSAYTKTSWADGKTEMRLVFSDEFNTDGRSFYPGDDPYWEAVDLHYWVYYITWCFFSLVADLCTPRPQTILNGMIQKLSPLRVVR